MGFHRKTGKYSRKKANRKLKVLLLLTAMSAVLLCSVSIGACLLHNRMSDADFAQLASQIGTEPQQTQMPEASIQSTAAGTQETTVPGTTALQTSIPETTAPKVILPQYAELYAQNSDFFGWVKIEGTKIDYPVMHAPAEREKYLHANFQGEYSYPGTPFLDETATGDSDNLLIYAHNMPNGTMFRDLMKYEQKNFWASHPTIVFNTLYEEQEFEILAAFYDRVYYKTEDVFKFYQFIDAENEEDFNHAIAQFKDKALYDTGVDAEYGDQLITLVTCAYHTDNGRFVVVAKRK